MNRFHIPDGDGTLCNSNSFVAQTTTDEVCRHCVLVFRKLTDPELPTVQCMGALFKFPDRASYRKWLRVVVAGMDWNLRDFGAFQIAEYAPNVTDIIDGRGLTQLLVSDGDPLLAAVPRAAGVLP